VVEAPLTTPPIALDRFDELMSSKTAGRFAIFVFVDVHRRGPKMVPHGHLLDLVARH
jgi:hypothetical protein